MDATTIRANPSDLTEAVADLLAGLDATSLSGRERADWMRSLTEADAMLTAARSRLVSAGVGGPTVRTAELVDRTGMSGAEARRAVRLADALVAVPAAADALADGRITTGHASVLTHDVSWLNRPAAALDASLVEAACQQSVDEFRATVAEWERVENGDPDGARLAARQHRNRTLSWTTGADGMVRLRGDLAPEAGAMVTGAIRDMADRLWRTEDGRASATDGLPAAPGPSSSGMSRAVGCRTPVQRNADALEELCRRGARSSGSGSDPGPGATGQTRPRVDLLVTVGLDRLRAEPSAEPPAGPAGPCRTADGVDLPPATVRRLACDAGVLPVVMGSAGEILDVGRRSRTVPTAIRNALIARDGGCTHPGCSAPVSWCDAHHVVHWADGGPTSLENLVLLCSAHHHLVHEHTTHEHPVQDRPDRGRTTPAPIPPQRE